MSLACQIELRRDERRASGRIEDGLARLLVPRAGGLEEIAVSLDLLPDALARLLDLGPRPAPAAPEPLRMSAQALAEALGPGEGTLAVPSAKAGDEALRCALAGRHARWRVELRRQSPTESEGLAEIEVLDTDAGLWLIVSAPPQVELRPATSTAVFAHLAALASAARELGEGAAG